MKKSNVVGLVILMLCMAGVRAHAQRAAAPSPWVSASGGTIPEGAVAHGQEADGREQYVCRGAYEGGTHIGKITRGFSGCNIGYGGQEITLPDYEVFVQQRRVRETAVAVAPSAAAIAVEQPRSSSIGAMTRREGIEVSAATRVTQPRLPSFGGSVPPTPPDATRKRGFDENGQPYVEVKLPDGTIKRTSERGVTLIKPDGTSQFIPFQKVRSDAPVPTPPELPEDPKGGMAWMELHNEELLDVISFLVNRDQAEMKKFAASEKKAKAESVFDQIAFRTKVASFLAQER